jgi:hypothetical protein
MDATSFEVSAKVHGVFTMSVATREFKVENFQKESSNMAEKAILIVYLVPGYCHLGRTFGSRKRSIAKQDS